MHSTVIPQWQGSAAPVIGALERAAAEEEEEKDDEMEKQEHGNSLPMAAYGANQGVLSSVKTVLKKWGPPLAKKYGVAVGDTVKGALACTRTHQHFPS